MAFDATAVKAVNEIVLNAYSGIYPGLGGGEFTAYTSQNFLSYYAPVALLPASSPYSTGPYLAGASTTGFETLCIETGVEFTPGNWGNLTPYTYTLGYSSQPPPPPNGSGNGLPLATGAAYLYYLFGTGNLPGFNYAYSSSGEAGSRMYDDNLLQAAIWAFQGQQSYSGYTVPSSNPSSPNYNPYYAYAISVLGGLSNANSAYTGPDVEILQLWSGTISCQNQLVLTGNTPWSVPDAPRTAGLLGISLLGLALFQLRRSKTT